MEKKQSVKKDYTLRITALICLTIISIILIIALTWGNMGLKYFFTTVGVLTGIFIFIILPEYISN